MLQTLKDLVSQNAAKSEVACCRCSNVPLSQIKYFRISAAFKSCGQYVGLQTAF